VGPHLDQLGACETYEVKPAQPTARRNTMLAQQNGRKRQQGNTILAPCLRRRTSVASPARNAARSRAISTARPSIAELKTVVVNLQRRHDHMEGCRQRLLSVCPQLPFERVDATDGRQAEIPLEEVTTSWNTARNVEFQKQRAIRKGWNDLETYQVRQLELSPGERGCASSHVRAWRHCLEQAKGTDQPLLVLEDDAAPTAEFCEVLEQALATLPEDADLLYLGYSQAADWRREVSRHVVESHYVWTTVAYIVWPLGARKMLSKLPVNEPVDNWMAGLCAENDIKAYCVRPKIVLQADAWNVNSDVAHSDEHYWGPNSDIQHSDALYWGPGHPEAGGDPAGGLLWDLEDLDDLDSDSEDL